MDTTVGLPGDGGDAFPCVEGAAAAAWQTAAAAKMRIRVESNKEVESKRVTSRFDSNHPGQIREF
jgi:hypothetical protein